MRTKNLPKPVGFNLADLSLSLYGKSRILTVRGESSGNLEAIEKWLKLCSQQFNVFQLGFVWTDEQDGSVSTFICMSFDQVEECLEAGH